ncbi:MAG: hypothetical protein ACRESJ_22485 [Pseudomonas sp.]|uniref:hypothetical protein n=1 Tax=Pseudomonas sp. TaxID=306 RepID=UPI003D6FDD3D
MNKAVRNPLFLIGIPLAFLGVSVGIKDLLEGQMVGFSALGLLIQGLAFMLAGWLQRKR